MSRANRRRAMECVAGAGSWLAPGAKLALLLIGDLVRDGSDYWEAQQNLAQRMGVTRRTAGNAVRKLTQHGALRFLDWQRTPDGATVKAFSFEPEMLTQVGEAFPPETEPGEPQVGRSVHPGGKNATPTWEETRHEVGTDVPQTGMNRTEPIQNRDKLAPPAQLLPTIDTEQELETERQRQHKALEEMTHAIG